MASKEIREVHFECDGCSKEAQVDKKDGEHAYPGGWFRHVLRGKTESGRKEFDLCPDCTVKLIEIIEEGLV